MTLLGKDVKGQTLLDVRPPPRGRPYVLIRSVTQESLQKTVYTNGRGALICFATGEEYMTRFSNGDVANKTK